MRMRRAHCNPCRPGGIAVKIRYRFYNPHNLMKGEEFYEKRITKRI